jgi:hypothetical protein
MLHEKKKKHTLIDFCAISLSFLLFSAFRFFLFPIHVPNSCLVFLFILYISACVCSGQFMLLYVNLFLVSVSLLQQSPASRQFLVFFGF